MSVALEDSAPDVSRAERIAPAAMPRRAPDLAGGVLRSAVRAPLFLLTLITALGAALRFVSLQQPSLWGDEAFTYSRVCGSFREMLDILQFNGFMPLHYILYWWIGQQVDLSPVMMRLPVALAGAFMPPAMYFLARQLGISTRTSLVVALFTACSAYMLCYSRDAKMYMPFWLFATVHVACLLWWLAGVGDRGQREEVRGPRTAERLHEDGRDLLRYSPASVLYPLSSFFSPLSSALAPVPASFRYLCWLASGLAMIGYHALGLMIVGIEVLIFVMHPAASRAIAATLVTIALLPWAIVSAVIRLLRVPWPADRARWFAPMRGCIDGLSWWAVPAFLAGALAIKGVKDAHFDYFSDYFDRVLGSAEAETRGNWAESGINWVPLYNRERDGLDLLKFTGTAFLMSWEWPEKTVAANVDPRAVKVLMTSSIVFAGIAILGLFPWRSWWRTESSVEGESPRGELVECAAEPLSRSRNSTIGSAGASPFTVVVLWSTLVILACLALWLFIGYSQSSHLSPTARQLIVAVLAGGWWIAAIVAALISLFWVSAASWWRTNLLILAWLALPAFAVYCRSIQPFYGPLTMLNALGESFAQAWWLIALVGLSALLSFWFSDRSWRGRFTKSAMVLLIAFVLVALLAVAYGFMAEKWRIDQVAGRRWHNIWMPRYLGALWPAFAIALCVLIMRLPTRTFRTIAIALLVSVNLAQFGVRVWGGSEPPTNRMARDIIDAQPAFVRHQQLTLDVLRQTQAMAFGQEPRLEYISRQLALLPVDEQSTTRVYLNTGLWGPEPGGGVVGSFAMRYYLCVFAGVEPTPAQFRRFRNILDRSFSYAVGLSPKLIAAEIRADRSVDRIITWDRLDRGRRDVNYDDPLPAALGSAWRRSNEEVISARDHWTWMNKYQLRRREYVRVRAPAMEATQPATGRPATRPAATRPATTRPAATRPAATRPATHPAATQQRPSG